MTTLTSTPADQVEAVRDRLMQQWDGGEHAEAGRRMGIFLASRPVAERRALHDAFVEHCGEDVSAVLADVGLDEENGEDATEGDEGDEGKTAAPPKKAARKR